MYDIGMFDKHAIGMEGGDARWCESVFVALQRIKLLCIQHRTFAVK